MKNSRNYVGYLYHQFQQIYFSVIVSDLLFKEKSFCLFSIFIISILHYSRLVIRELTIHFFSSPFSEQVELFILPSIAAHNEFPFNVWLQVQTCSLL